MAFLKLKGWDHGELEHQIQNGPELDRGKKAKNGPKVARKKGNSRRERFGTNRNNRGSLISVLLALREGTFAKGPLTVAMIS